MKTLLGIYPIILPMRSGGSGGRMTDDDIKVMIAILIILHIIAAICFLIRFFLIKSGKIKKKYSTDTNYNLYMPFGLEFMTFVPLIIDAIILLIYLGTLLAEYL